MIKEDKVRYGMTIQVLIPLGLWLVFRTDWLLAILIVSGFVALVGGWLLLIKALEP